ncbi:delta(8)-fatty-acid desaturase 2-like [Iris pallida]|uniref:Delta(8)-fatty-acid desaturase 2-like n=1 Tax=Iris pallida TaxID=29817 RepID=A0AAX6E2A0_IRIPA|nr:delta(8)-fatty-acid desaturase 2-like [Iris pallida]
MGSTKDSIVTAEALRSHNNPSDLWISIQGKVYDVTRWSKEHPGGDLPLLHLAGQDVTDAFLAYHPASAWAHLDRFLVGRFADYRVSPASKDYRRLLAEFTKAGLFDRKGHGTFLSLAAMLLLLLSSVLGVLASRSPLAHLVSAVSMGLLWIQSGWIGHNSGHYTVMATPSLNRLAQIVSGNCLTGVSIGWWKRNHNAHHIACNSLEFDPDLQHMPFFAVSPRFFSSLTSWYYHRTMSFDPLSRFLVSVQHWTFYPVMCLARLNLFAQSLSLLLSRRSRVPRRRQEILGIAVFWTWFPLLVSCLPTWRERATFVLVSFSVTGVQHVQFCLNHFSSAVYVGTPGGNDWFEKQTEGTLNILCPPWMDWFHGGLQFQVEHHLFPRLPTCHLRTVAPLVRDLCGKHGLPYDTAGFLEANRRTVRVLRNAALQARDLNSPVPKNLVWEAVNTHG